MALPPLLKRRATDATVPPAADATELQARTRARRRLVGAAVLLVVGVIAFPLLFETQPRPVPVDIPMVIPSREGAAPLTPPARPSRADSGTIAPAPGSAVAPAAPASTPAAPFAAPSTPAPAAAVAPTPPASVPNAKAIERIPERPPEKAASAQPVAKPASAAKPAPAKVEPKPEPPKPEPKKPEPKKPEAKVEAKTGRFVVQVGAYADEASTREARQRVEKLGLKTYTQTVEVQGATRIRVRIGPFETVQEANQALATLKAAKLPGAVLTL